MKKIITRILCMAVALTMLLGFAGCGESEKKKEATEAFNKTSDAFNEVADLVNANIDAIDEDLVAVFHEMSAALTECKENIEKSDASDEDYDKVIKALGDVDDWLKEAKVEIESEISNAE